MKIPKELKYSKDHEWVSFKNGVATIGITDFAQSELGDIVFVEFPMIGEQFNQGDSAGTIEAVKTVADIFCPVKGEIVAINDNIEDSPECINHDPYGDGWLLKFKVDSEEFDALMTPDDYLELIQ